MGGGNAKQAKPTQGVTPDEQAIMQAQEDAQLDADLDEFFQDEDGLEDLGGGAAGDGSGTDIAETTNFVFELIPYYDESDPDTANQIIETLESVTSQGVNIDTRDGFGNTLLMMSVHHQKEGLVKWALSQGANIDSINFAGVCAMHIACHESSGSFALSQLLVNYGADLEITDSNGCTVLHYGASAGDSNLVSLLINAGASSLAKDLNQFMPLDYALESGSEQCAALLLDAQTTNEDELAAQARGDETNDHSSNFGFSRTKSSVSMENTTEYAEYNGEWIEYIDQNSNTPYYFNQTTGETTWERPEGMQTTLADTVLGAEGHFDGSVERDIPDSVIAKTKKKKSKKKKKDKGKESIFTKETKELRKANESKEANESKTAVKETKENGSYNVSRVHRNLALWRRVAYREGIKKVAAKKRRLAVQAAREHMMMEQQAMQAQRDAEMKLHMAEERKKLNAGTSLQEQEIAKLREEFAKRERELRAALEEEAAKSKGLDLKIKEQTMIKDKEIKRREQEREEREVQRSLESKEKEQARETEIKKQQAEIALMQKKLNETHTNAGKKQKETEEKLKKEILEREQLLQKERDEVAKWKNESQDVKQKNELASQALKKEQRLRKKYYNEMEDMKGAIRVYCRVRPISASEKKKNCKVCIAQPDDMTVNVKLVEKDLTKTYNFDKIYDGNTDQKTVFADSQKLIQSAVDGYNVCIFAYGQTGTGKTWTMAGDRDSEANRGIMPRAFNEIFDIAERDRDKIEINVSMYMLELYCGNLIDLLLDRSDDEHAPPPPKIVIRKNEYGTIMPQGVVIKKAKNSKELFEVSILLLLFEFFLFLDRTKLTKYF